MAKIILNVDLNYEGASADIKKLKADLQGLGDPKGAKNIDSLRKSYSNLINAIQGSEKNYKNGTFSKILEEAKKGLNDLKDPSKQTDENFKNLSKTLGRLQADFAEAKTSATNFHGSLKDIIGGFAKFQLAAMLVMKPLQLINNAFDSLNETLVETEKRVVALQRVAGSAANAGDLYKMAQQYGQSFENVADVVERFAKSGYDWSESIKAAEAALTAMNVAELDAEQSSEGLIAVMKQYGYEIEHLDYIIGVLNKTSDTAAVTTEELLIALQKTGSTAQNANVSFEETVGLITALSEGTAASGQNIGNALRSLFVFTSDNKALDKFAGLSSGMAETVKNYRAGQASILDIWKGLGSHLQGMGSQKGTLEDLFGGSELTADIEAQLTQITDSFAEIYGTAGNYRQNYFIALLNNIDEVTRATENLGDVTSYSAKENEKYLDTYEGKVTSLEAKWQELANDEQGFLAFKKGLVDVGNGILTFVEWTGGLRTTLIAVGFAATAAFGPKLVSSIKSIITALKGATAAAAAFQSATGILGLVATGLSVVIGLFQQHTEAIRESRRETVAAWEANKDYAESLLNLYEQYTNLEVGSSSYLEVEKNLTEIIEKKTDKLKGLKEGTDEYAEALKQATIAELENLKTKQQNAKIAAEDNLLGLGTSKFKELGSYMLGGEINPSKAVFSNLGIGGGNTLNFGFSGMKDGNTVEAKIFNFNRLKEIRDLAVKKHESTSDKDEKADLRAFLNAINRQIADLEPYVTDYLSASESIEEIAGMIEDKTSNIQTNVSNTKKTLAGLADDELKEIVNEIDKIRDATRETYEYEEKKKAVLEAEKALIDAQNNRTVRVYNEAAGRWEWASNEKDVETARENLEKARAAVENQFFVDIKAEVSTGNATNASILAIITKWASAYGTGDFSTISNSIASMLKEKFGIDIYSESTTKTPWKTYEEAQNAGFGDQVMSPAQYRKEHGSAAMAGGSYQNYLASQYNKLVYDSGGVLSGLGGIKATSADEVVLDPAISRQLLNPVSNKQFDTFVKDLGLLFGASKSVAGSNVFGERVASGVDSHDRHYSVNGIPIPADTATRYTLAEIFQNMDLIPDF